jgi:Domain of unkown function (DUF1775)
MTRQSILRRTLAVLATTGGLLAASAPAVFAHAEFDLDEVAPGSIVALHLSVENESQTAGTTQVELRFPQPLVIVELPTAEGWTATAVDGTVGAEAIGVLWVRPTASPDEDPSLPLTIGPLPASEGRMQFKVLQTYSDGTEDAWISDWPVGEPEPDKPGPVLDLVAGAPGTIPEPTTTTTTTPADIPDTTPVTQAPIASAPDTQPATADTPAVTNTVPTSTPQLTAATTDSVVDTTTSSDDDSNTGLIIGIVAIAAAAIAATVLIVRHRRTTP